MQLTSNISHECRKARIITKNGIFSRAIVLLVAVFIVGNLSIVARVMADNVIKIGLSAPLSGDWQNYGQDFKNACQLVIDDVNAAGGIQGKKLVLLAEDSQGDPKKAVMIAAKFVADPDVVAEIGDFSSSCCMAAAPIYERADMVQLSPSSSHAGFTKMGKNMFGLIGTMAQEGPFNAEWAVTDLGKKKIATIYINNEWGLYANKHFVTAAQNLGADILGQEDFLPGQKDFTAILAKVKRLQPELIFLSAFSADAVILMNQAKQLRIEAMFMSTTSLFSDKTIELGGSAVNGLLLPVNYFHEDLRPAAQEFLQRYQGAYDQIPNQFAAVAYDAARLIVAALSRMEVIDRAGVREGLIRLKDFEGATGPISYAETRNPVKEFVRIIVDNGKWTLWNAEQER